MWNLPRPGIKLVFSAFADGVLTTVSPRKSIRCFDIAKAKVLFLLGGYYICMLLSRFSCVWLCDPIDSSPSGSPVPGILQARTLEWVAISFSNVWKWKVKVKSLSRVRLLATPWTAAHQAPLSMGFSRQECWSGVPLPSPIIYVYIFLISYMPGTFCIHNHEQASLYK